jgi:membrane protein DedA with SNARE-associated domain
VLLAFLDSLLEFLTGSEWTYLLLFAFCAGDVLLPALPSESAVIICGLQAARGELSLTWVLVAAAAGAFVGDNTSYASGRFLGTRVQEKLFSGEKASRRLEWAKGFLRERGGYVFLVARFIPGGRTATTFTAGLVRLPWLRRFGPFVFVAAVLWAGYGAAIGYFGGRMFRDQPIYALLLAFGLAAVIGAAGEAYRRARAS